MKNKIIAGNWKMNKTAEQAEAFCRELLKNGSDCGNRVIIFVPYTDLSLCARLCENSFAAVGAQNVHWENSGAFTGEISAQMLREAARAPAADLAFARTSAHELRLSARELEERWTAPCDSQRPDRGEETR